LVLAEPPLPTRSARNKPAKNRTHDKAVMKHAESAASYDVACFRILAYELGTDDPNDFDQKIRRKAKSSGLGAYAPERVAVIRTLKNDLQAQTQKPHRSIFYLSAKVLTPTPRTSTSIESQVTFPVGTR
jgi:hypothetical protein